MRFDEPTLDAILIDMGFNDFDHGTKYLRTAVRFYAASGGEAMLTKEVYPAVAGYHRSTPARVERCIRHSIEKAWAKARPWAKTHFFGQTWAEGDRPAVGHFVARLAYLVDKGGRP